jgi:hypothetical protein
LYQNEQRNTPIGIQETQQSAQPIERLSDHNATLDRLRKVNGSVIPDEIAAESAYPAPVGSQPEQQNVDPVNQQSDPVLRVLGE